MPTEQTEVEYYHYYRASQRRVQQWVQNTSRELEEAGTAGRSSDLRLMVVGDNNSKDAGRGENSSGSRRTGGGSRRRSSSSSKLQIHDQVDSSRSRGPSSRSRSTRKKAKTSNDVKSRKPHLSDGLTTSSLLSLGLFPLIFVLTPPSVATLFSATILLAGYFSVDYRVKYPQIFFVSFLG